MTSRTVGQPWYEVAAERIRAGEDERAVMADYGWGRESMVTSRPDRSEYWVTIGDVEQAYNALAKSMSVTDPTELAEGWHTFFVHLLPIAVDRAMNETHNVFTKGEHEQSSVVGHP